MAEMSGFSRQSAAPLLLMVGLSSCATPQGAGEPHRFQDCAACPPMVIVPAGNFVMGSAEGEGDADEHPAHGETVAAFALGEREVTRGEWAAFVKATGHPATICHTASGGSGTWRDPGYAQDDSEPVVCVGWRDAADYTAWLSAQTGRHYRLPSEAEWEYAARAGSTGNFAWGASADRRFANYGADSCCGPEASGADRWLNTAPVASFAPNAFGLFDMNGNVWEWVQNCYAASYGEAPPADCAERVIRGGSWLYPPSQMRAASRRRHATPGISLGFRVARDLEGPSGP